MEIHYCYNCFKEREEGGGPCPFCGYDPSSDRDKYPFALHHGSILAGQYITGRVLGQGGFGITYLALDKMLELKVAVKEFLPDTMAVRATGSPKVTVYTGERQDNFRYGLERFLDEARVLAKFLGNPNIVGVRSYFEENGTAYFVMDYIEGLSFKNYIKNQGGKVPWRDAARILTPVMDALGSVHREGIIHRDVTPDNIYITGDGTVKLLDFGSARYSLGDKSRSLDVVLKAGYAPKEQYTRKGRQGPYTDVYSLAACFYAAVTGYLPPESLERMDEDDLIPPSTRGIKLPPALEDAILKGLEVQPADRFQSMEEFRAALDEAMAEQPEPEPGPVPGAASEPESEPIPEPPPEPTSQISPEPQPASRTEPEAVPQAEPAPAPGPAPAVRRSRRPFILAGGAAAALIIAAVTLWPFLFPDDSLSGSGGGGGETLPPSAAISVSPPSENPGDLGGEELEVLAPETAQISPSPSAEAAISDPVPQESVPPDSPTDKDAAADQTAADKAAADKAAADKAAADKAAADKAAADKAAADKAAADKAAADKAAADKAAADKAAADKANQEFLNYKAEVISRGEKAKSAAATAISSVEKAKDSFSFEDSSVSLLTTCSLAETNLNTAIHAYNQAGQSLNDKSNVDAYLKAIKDLEKATSHYLAIIPEIEAAKEAAAKAAEPAKVTSEPYTMVTSKFSVSGTYTGEWKDGKPNGEGTMTITQTDDRWDYGDTLWSASWSNGLIEGYGQWRSAVDGAYDGNFKKGLKSGYGKMWFSDGTVYDGSWSGGDFVG